MSRTIEVDADSAKDAEKRARDRVLFTAAHPVDRTYVGWVNPEPEADPNVVHLEGCWGNHCKHYGCDTDDTAIDYREYCSQCDVEAYG